MLFRFFSCDCFVLGFDDALRRREHEFRIQSDEMSAKVLEYELKVNLIGMQSR